jgi:hypothetical protein
MKSQALQQALFFSDIHVFTFSIVNAIFGLSGSAVLPSKGTYLRA